MGTLAALFSDIADAIREKDGTTDTIVANDFPERISAIQTKSEPKTVSIEFRTTIALPLNVYVEYSTPTESGIITATKKVDIAGGKVFGVLANTIAYIHIGAEEDFTISFKQKNSDFDLISQGRVPTGTTSYDYFAVIQLKEATAVLWTGT